MYALASTPPHTTHTHTTTHHTITHHTITHHTITHHTITHTHLPITPFFGQCGSDKVHVSEQPLPEGHFLTSLHFLQGGEREGWEGGREGGRGRGGREEGRGRGEREVEGEEGRVREGGGREERGGAIQWKCLFQKNHQVSYFTAQNPFSKCCHTRMLY